MLTTTKSLILLSFLLAFAVALQDGDQIAFKTHASPFNPKYQYLTTGTADGSVGMIRNIDYSQASGTWWKAHELSDGNWAFESLGGVSGKTYLNGNTHIGSVNLAANTDDATASGTHWALETLSDGNVALKTLASFKNRKFVYLNADTIHGVVDLGASTASGIHWEIVPLIPTDSSSSTTANQQASNGNQQIPDDNSQLADFIKAHADELKGEPDVDVDYCLQQFTSTTFESQYGPIMGAIIEAGCADGLQLCDLNDLYGVINQLVENGFDEASIKQIDILIGSMIGSMTGEAACEGVPVCAYLGGKIGTCLTCLSVSKEVFEGIVEAVSTLESVAIQAGDIGQDALNAINYAANTVANGVQTAIDQINKGAEDDAMNALQDVTDQVGQGFTDLGSAIENGLNDLGNQIVGGLNDAGQAIVDTANQAGQAITDTANQAGNAIVGVGQDIANGFCGIFGC